MIPVNTPLLGELEKTYLNQCIDTGWISSEGPFVGRFEKEMANYCNRDFGVAVSSGSAALDIAIKAIGIEEGDEVIMPSFTIISPAYSIVRQGGIPVLVDSNMATWNMDTSQIEAKITSKTKAIVVVHIYGLPVDLDPILEIGQKYNLKIIEDAAEMIGQTYKGKPCGGFGDVSIFSFYPNKHITTGEGGMLLTNDLALAEKCQELRNLSFMKGRRFVHKDIGWNYRMTNLQAALGLAQLENLNEHIKRKRSIGKLYNSLIKNDIFQKPLEETNYATNIYWVYGLLSKTDNNAEEFTAILNKEGIGTRPFFYPMHRQPFLIDRGLYRDEQYPISELLADTGFYIPSGLGIRNEEIEFVAGTINNL